MLELRPGCEHCNAPLPPNSLDARICSFECTFCATCAEELLRNVCPNCGGGFVPRPVRPSKNWKNDNFLGAYPPSRQVKHRPVDLEAHRGFATAIAALAPEER
jgi:hypothetical protein